MTHKLVRLSLLICAIALAPQALQADSAPQKITATVIKYFPPLYSLDKEGKPQGFAIDVMEEVASAAGFEITYLVKDNWTQTAQALKDGEADLIPNLGITKTRIADFDFSHPVETYPVSIIVRAETDDIRSAEDLSGKFVGVVKFNVGEKIARALSDIKTRIYGQPENALFGLLAGRVDALIFPKTVMLKVAHESGLSDHIKITDKPLKEIKRAVAVRKGNAALLEQLNAAIDKFTKTHRYKSIYTKWHGNPAPFWGVTRVLIVAGSIFLVTIILAVIWRYYAIASINKRLVKTIEERKQAEKALQKSEQLTRTVIKTLPDLVWLKDQNGVYLACNPVIERLFGAKETEIVGKTDYDFFNKELADFFRENDKAAMESGGPRVNEEEITYADDGHSEIVETIKTPMFDSNGELVGVLGIARDITERKHADETVRNIATGVSAQTGEAFFQSLVMHLAKLFDTEYTFIGLLDEQRPGMIDTVALCVHGEVIDNLSYALANTPCKHVVDGSCDELQAFPRDIQRLFPDDHLLVEMDAHSYVGAPLADTNNKPIGLIVVMDNKPMENTDRVETILRIFAARAAAEMERLRADKALQESQKMLQLILDSIPVRVFWKDRDCVYLGCNQHFARDAGLESPEQIIGKSDFELGWRQQAELYRSDDQQVMQSGVAKLNYEEPQTWPDGTRLWLQTSKIPLRDLDSNIFGVLGIYEDITERKRAEEREKSLGQILDDSLNEIYIFDADTLRFIQVNRGAMANLGYSMEELQRLTPMDLKPEFTPEAFARLLAPLRNGEKEKIRFNTNHRRKDGSLYPVEIHLQLSTFESAPAFMAIILDITEHKQAEEALRRSQKMEAIGQLSGGIAHDFNNQLGVIIGYLDFLQEYAANDKEPSKWVNTATKATLRCMDLTRQLLTFSRRQPKEKTVVGLNALLRDLKTMITRSVTPEVGVQYFLADNLWPAEIDPGEFQDAILNLVINARDAMPSGGKLLIETSNKTLDADYVACNPEVEIGNYVELVLSDTGIGMDKEILERIFEPFFTTKPAGKGTGLGLAMVYGFVKRYAGHIKIYSEPGVGTTMHLYLPRSTAAESAAIAEDTQAADIPTGNESILVVDDEADLLQLADEYLSSLGYRTRCAENAAQALEKLAGDEKFDLLFSDVVMPGGMNGYELAQQAIQQKPGLKVLLTSGFTSKTMANNGLARFSNHLLSKPYRKDDLAQHVRQVLDEESAT